MAEGLKLLPAVTCRCAHPIGVSNHGWRSKWVTVVCQRCHLTIPPDVATSAAYRISQYARSTGWNDVERGEH